MPLLRGRGSRHHLRRGISTERMQGVSDTALREAIAPPKHREGRHFPFIKEGAPFKTVPASTQT